MAQGTEREPTSPPNQQEPIQSELTPIQQRMLAAINQVVQEQGSTLTEYQAAIVSDSVFSVVSEIEKVHPGAWWERVNDEEALTLLIPEDFDPEGKGKLHDPFKNAKRQLKKTTEVTFEAVTLQRWPKRIYVLTVRLLQSRFSTLADLQKYREQAKSATTSPNLDTPGARTPSQSIPVRYAPPRRVR